MTLGSFDANGVPRYTETTPIGTEFSDYMNLGLEGVSAAMSLNFVQIGSPTLPASSSGTNKTVRVNFPTAFAAAPHVVLSPWIAGSGNAYIAVAESIDATGFTMRVVNAPVAAWSGAVGPFPYIARGSRP